MWIRLVEHARHGSDSRKFANHAISGADSSLDCMASAVDDEAKPEARTRQELHKDSTRNPGSSVPSPFTVDGGGNVTGANSILHDFFGYLLLLNEPGAEIIGDLVCDALGILSDRTLDLTHYTNSPRDGCNRRRPQPDGQCDARLLVALGCRAEL